jgi:Transposase DDE domain
MFKVTKQSFMKDFTIAIYCFVDDLLQEIHKSSSAKGKKLSDSQVITIAIISARYFYGNHHAACVYMRDHWGFTIPDKSNYNRQLHKLSDLLSLLFYHLSAVFKHLNIESVYIIDSFPVSICKNIRIPRSKLLKGEEYRGFNASKREYFYGFKVHMITTGRGIPVEIFITAGSVHDNTAMQMMDIDLPENSHLYADSAYLNKD